MSGSPSGLNDHVGRWLRLLSDEVHLSFERRLATHDVTVAQWNVLVCLYRGDGQTIAELARFIQTDTAAVSRLIDRLTDKGLVGRHADPSSRRRVLLALTPRAVDLVPDLIALADANDDEFFSVLSERRRAELIRLLRRLTSHAHTITASSTARRSTSPERQQS